MLKKSLVLATFILLSGHADAGLIEHHSSSTANLHQTSLLVKVNPQSIQQRVRQELDRVNLSNTLSVSNARLAPQPTPVPEPDSLLISLIGLTALFLTTRKRKSKTTNL